MKNSGTIWKSEYKTSSLGGVVVTQMTENVRDNDPNRIDIIQQIRVLRLHFMQKRNKLHSRTDF